jgi:hypothetical protein
MIDVSSASPLDPTGGKAPDPQYRLAMNVVPHFSNRGYASGVKSNYLGNLKRKIDFA